MQSGLSDDVTREYGKVITTSSGCTFDSCFGNKPAAAEQPLIPHPPQRGEGGANGGFSSFNALVPRGENL